MDFGALPPEINSTRMYTGAGAESLLSASVAWDELAAELATAASSYLSVIAGLTSGPWLGPAAIAAAAAATPFAVWMGATSSQAEQAAAQARAAISAYEAAYAMTVPPAVIAANRTLLAALVATNFFGQNSPAIAATEAHYSEMWAQDAAAMYGYAASSAAASTLAPFETPPQIADPAGAAAQAAAVSATTGEAAATQATLASLVSAVPGALQGMAAPASLGTAAAGIPIGTSSGDIANLLNIMVMPLFAISSVLGIAQTMQGMAAAATQVGEAAAEAAEVAAGAAAAGAEVVGGAALGAMGQAASLGSLSVPPAWTSVIPTAHLTGVSSALPGAAPGAVGNVPPSLLGGMPRAAAGQGPAAGPRYGLVPTVMAQPPSAGYGV